MRRLPPEPSRSTSNHADADRLSSAAAPDIPGSPRPARTPRNARTFSRRSGGLPGTPPLPDRQHAQESFRGATRAGQAPATRTGGGRRSADREPATGPGRTVRAGGPPRSIDQLLDAWVHADPGQTEARQQAALIIRHCQNEQHSHLDLSGLDLRTLPDCLERLALLELTLTDCRLQRLPQLPPTLTALNVRQNRLIALPPLPASLIKLDATANCLQRLPCLPDHLETLAVGGNALRAVRDVPKTLTFLDLSSNCFNRLPELPATLRYLNLSNNLPMDLHGLPSTLAELEICHMRLLSVPALPVGLTRLSVRDNDLIELRELPPGLTHLNVSGNRLHALPALPATLSHLIARSNRIRQLPILPDSLINLDVSHNALTSLPPSIETARRLSHIDLSLNQIPRPRLAAFVGTMQSLGKNMSCIHFDRVRQTPLEHDAVSPSTAIEGPSPRRRMRAQRVTDMVPAGASGGEDLPEAPVPPSISAVDPGQVARTDLERVPTADGLDDWHLVEGLSEWEEVPADDLPRPQAK